MTIRENFAETGIHRASEHLFNRRNALVLLIISENLISSVIFMVNKAKTVREYLESFYGSVTSLAATVLFLSDIYNALNIFDLIANFEKILHSSKFLFSFTSNDNLLVIRLSNSKSTHFSILYCL